MDDRSGRKWAPDLRRSLDVPGIRRLRNPGAERILRAFVLVLFVGSMIQTIAVVRPDLVRPADIGTDTSNYYAAAQRLATGSTLYALQPGDRPVPKDNAPWWTVPLLSPPADAVLWRGLLPVPPALALNAWWIGGALLSSAFIIWLILRLNMVALAIAAVLVYPASVLAWSGNVSAYLVPAVGAVWVLTRDPSKRRSVTAAGALVAVATALKLAPIVMVLWFVSRRRAVGLIGFGVVAAAIGLASLTLAGMQAHFDYLAIAAADRVSAATPLSVGGMLRSAGAPDPIVGYAPALVAATGAVAALLLRRHPKIAFAALGAASVLASPVVRSETIAQGLVCLVPWAATAPPALTMNVPAWRRHLGRQATAVVLSAWVVVAVVLAAQTPTTSVLLQNDSDSAVVVRFHVLAGTASFGFIVPPSSSGWAWRNQVGGMSALVTIFDSACQLRYRQGQFVTGGMYVIEATEVRVTDVAGGGNSSPFLGFTSECAEALGPNRP